MSKTTRDRLMVGAAAMPMLLAALPSYAQTAAPAPTPPAPVVAPAPTSTDASIQPERGFIRGWRGFIRGWRGFIRGWSDTGPIVANTENFWGATNPYTADPNFWGTLKTYNGGNTGDYWAAPLPLVNTYWNTTAPQMTSMETSWQGLGDYNSNKAGYDALAQQIWNLFNTAQSTWSGPVGAKAHTSFAAAIATPLLNEYGIDLSDPSTLANVAPEDRIMFWVDYYDQVMNYSGTDHVDHWMKEVNWSPVLTQQTGMSGTNSTIGLLDFSITGQGTGNVVKYGGTTTADDHGSAVASLIVGAHDGQGVMGIAPKASVIEYNPFDSDGTADWPAITTGVAMLAKSGASVINASLGISGYTLPQGWNDVFTDKTVRGVAGNAIFVLAAGNDGIVQPTDITWDKKNPALIVVGSVGPTGVISDFSNQPGNACLLDGKKCNGDYLMNHFIVAPGEMMLVDDGQGGVTRMTGTSFAAPLVSGTIALIQDRWPWLTNYPADVTNIVLKSAKDLGAPGVDPVYGVGELDVGAALSPLDWSKLTFYQTAGGVTAPVTATVLRASAATQRPTWEATGAFVTLMENTGQSYRDFEVPLSSKLANQTVSVQGSPEQFMSYLTARFNTWVSTPAGPAAPTPPAPPAPKFDVASEAFSDVGRTSASLAGFGFGEASISMSPIVMRPGFRYTGLGYQTAAHIGGADHGLSMDFGNGDGGAVMLGGQHGFGMASDYDVDAGGANPFLGLASGGAYGSMSMALSPRLAISGGVTQHSLRRNFAGQSLEQRQSMAGLDGYSASAANMTVTYRPARALTTSLGYTMLHEDHTLLGMGSTVAGDLPYGSTTDAATAGASLSLGRTLALSGSATVGRTRTGDTASGLAVGREGLVSSAFQVAASKQHLFDGHDQLRVTFAQPMHVERGSLAVTDVEVIDRETGALGAVTRDDQITGGQRRYVAEMLYGRSLASGRGQVALFGRANLSTQSVDLPAYTAGGSFRFSF